VCDVTQLSSIAGVLVHQAPNPPSQDKLTAVCLFKFEEFGLALTLLSKYFMILRIDTIGV